MAESALSLYVHFPWCVRKCPYCDFNSHAARGEIPEREYVDALLRDLDHELRALAQPPAIRTIFMGGGTPSLFSGAAVARLLDGVRARVALAADAEVTLEANPGTADAANFRAYRTAGVNRLSIGVQSFDAPMLKALGRIHGPDEARRAFELARAAGFGTINLDLMYALPSQSAAQARADLDAAIALGPEHLSYYHLTIEPNTEFAARPPAVPDGDTAWELQLAGQARLAEAGYAQYEVSAYARDGRRCAHNLAYWTYGDYLGIGAGAHGKLTQGGRVHRRARHKHPRTWLEGAGTAAAIQEDRRVAPEELPFEYAMNALRLNHGFDVRDFTAATGLPGSALEAPLLEGERLGLVERRGARVMPTERGRAFLNRLTALFLPAGPS